MQVVSDSIHDTSGLDLKKEEQLLLSCAGSLLNGLRPDPSQSLSADAFDRDTFLALTRSHGLSPLVAYLHEKDPDLPRLPEALLEQLEGDYRWSVCHNLLLQGHLRLILSAFRDSDIPVIVLKGAALAERLYPQTGLRLMRDIDILVQQPDVSKARRILEAAGFEGPSSQAREDLFIQHHHHLAPRLHRSTGAMVEIHWQLARPDRPYKLDMKEMWAHAREVSLAGVRCLELDPIDQLVHLCIHYLGDRLGKQPGGLLQLLDIALILRMHGDTISWADLNDRAIRYHVSSEVFTSLYICKTVFGASYSTEVDIALRPNNFDESKIETFIVHRVIGRGGDLPMSLIEALASQSWATRLRTLVHMLGAPKPWNPGVSGTKSRRSSPVRTILSLPARSIVAVRALANQIGQVRGQVNAERWIAQFDDERDLAELENFPQS